MEALASFSANELLRVPKIGHRFALAIEMMLWSQGMQLRGEPSSLIILHEGIRLALQAHFRTATEVEDPPPQGCVHRTLPAWA